MKLTESERRLLCIMRDFGGVRPERPFLNDEAAAGLMRRGLVELIRPAAPNIPYATITPAGRKALENEE